jgi:LuxR family transcriptional regulator, maltose regulon positive regulatory protein
LAPTYDAQVPASRDLRAEARTSVPPALAVEVSRAGVDRVLADATRCPVTVVTAGPGWGKTTTLANWARRHAQRGGEAVAWLGLTSADDSPSAFWDAVLQSVRASAVVPDGHPLALLSAVGGITDEVQQAVFRGLDTLPDPLLLILDDFHVIGDEDVMRALSELASQPTRVRLMILTRVDPPLPLHRLRVAGRLAEVSAADLAFDAEAVRALAARAESLDLADGTVDEVLARTEGWPAGVRLATMHLARAGAGGSLDGFGGTDTSVAEYLVAEVLTRNDAETRDFLLRTSVAEWISGDLAEALAPGSQGRARLESLERANQFIVPVNADRSIYRYHPLLRDLLMHTLQRDDPAAYVESHRAAATWLLAHQYPIPALHHAALAKDWLLAADCFVEASPSLVGTQGPALVAQLRQMPMASLAPSAAAGLCAAGLEFGLGNFSAMEGQLAEVRRRLADGDRLSPVAMALLENLACAAARARGDEASVVSTAEAALEHLSRAVSGPAADGNRAIALTQSAVGLLRSADTAAARARLAGVARDGSGADVGLAVLGSRGHLAWCDLAEANLDSAIGRAQRAISDAAARGWASQLQVRFAYLPLAVAQVLRGDADGADRVVAAGLAADANGVEVWSTFALHLAQATVAVSRRRPRAATAALDTARAVLGDRPVSPALADPVTRVVAEVAMLTKAPPDQPAADHRDSPTGWATRARLSLAADDLDAAVDAAQRVARTPESLDDLVAAIEAAVVEALVARRQRRSAAAALAMGEALALAAPQRIVRPFLVSGSHDIADLLRAAPPSPGDIAIREAALAALGVDGEAAVLAAEPEPLVEPLTERELAVLAELPTMRTNEEIARELYVSINTVKSHLMHLYRKLGVSSRRDAVRRARELGLIL